MSGTSSSDWSYAAFLIACVVGAAFAITSVFKEAGRRGRYAACLEAKGEAIQCAEATR